MGEAADASPNNVHVSCTSAESGEPAVALVQRLLLHCTSAESHRGSASTLQRLFQPLWQRVYGGASIPERRLTTRRQASTAPPTVNFGVSHTLIPAGIHCARRSLDALVHMTPTHPAFSDRHARAQAQMDARDRKYRIGPLCCGPKPYLQQAYADGRVTANTEGNEKGKSGSGFTITSLSQGLRSRRGSAWAPWAFRTQIPGEKGRGKSDAWKATSGSGRDSERRP